MKIDKKVVREYIVIVFGVFLTALAVSVFFEPSSLVTGGITGLGIIIESLFKDIVTVPLWLTNIIFNVPLFIAAIKIKGMRFVGRTLVATALFSPALFITAMIPIKSGDILLNAVFGGALAGAGLGFVFRSSATTGGSDLLAWLIRNKFKHVSISKMMLILDSLIVLAGLLVFGADKSLYAIIAAFVASKTNAAVLEGLSYAKAAYIISDKSDEIGRKLLSEIQRGGTLLAGKGLYTGQAKNIILCVVSSKEIVKLKEITRGIDEKAFLIVSDTREVMGEGFSFK